jgi:hypothetical protein
VLLIIGLLRVAWFEKGVYVTRARVHMMLELTGILSNLFYAPFMVRG